MVKTIEESARRPCERTERIAERRQSLGKSSVDLYIQQKKAGQRHDGEL